MSKKQTNLSIDGVITLIFFMLLGLSLLVITLYFITFHGNLSTKSSDWDAFGSLIGGISMLLFSVANIRIWLYQSNKNNDALLKQTKLTEKLRILSDIQFKLLNVTKIHMSYKAFQDVKSHAYKEIQDFESGVHGHVFINNVDLIKEAYRALERLENIWIEYRLPDPSTPNSLGETDIFDKKFQRKLLEQEEPIMKLIEHYRSQTTKL